VQLFFPPFPCSHAIKRHASRENLDPDLATGKSILHLKLFGNNRLLNHTKEQRTDLPFTRPPAFPFSPSLPSEEANAIRRTVPAAEKRKRTHKSMQYTHTIKDKKNKDHNREYMYIYIHTHTHIYICIYIYVYIFFI